MGFGVGGVVGVYGWIVVAKYGAKGVGVRLGDFGKGFLGRCRRLPWHRSFPNYPMHPRQVRRGLHPWIRIP